MGDFNLPEINWDNLGYPPSCENFVNALLEANLTQFVHTATRDNAILDLIFTTEASCIQNIDILEPLGTSDHNMVLVELGFVTSRSNGTNRPFKTKARDFKRVDWKVFQHHLLLVDWDRVFAHSNVDAVWGTAFCMN